MQEVATSFAAPFIGAASAPAPLPSQILAAFTNVIPEAPAPSAEIKVADFQGRPAAAFKLPTADTIFSALEKFGRRHLLQQGPGFPALPQPAGQAASASTDSSDGTWYQTNEGNLPPGNTQLQAQPQPLPQPQPQAVPLQQLAPAAQPGQADAAGAPMPALVAPGPAVAFGPIPSEVKVIQQAYWLST